MEPVTGEPEDLADVRERQRAIEGGGDLDGAGVQAALRVLTLSVRRGKNPRVVPTTRQFAAR
jgi:hypothetical protein